MKATPVELVTVETEDGFPLDGALYRPPTEIDRRQGFVVTHGKTGNFYTGTARFVPTEAVRRGFTCLSLNLRSHDLGYLLNSFEDRYGAAWERLADPRKDIRAGVQCLRAEGMTDVALLGHSAGGLFVADYATTDPDLTALVLSSSIPSLAPVPIMRWFAGDADSVSKAVRQAEEMVAAGRGQDLIMVPNWWYVVSANTLLEVVSQDPDALANAVRKIECPTLFIYGSKDSPTVLGSIERAIDATAARRKDVVVVEEADHFYIGRQEIMANAVSNWLEVVMER